MERAGRLTFECMLSYDDYVSFDELHVEHYHYCHLDGGVKTDGLRRSLLPARRQVA